MTSEPEAEKTEPAVPSRRANRGWIPPVIGLGLIVLIALVFFAPEGQAPPKKAPQREIPKLVRTVHHTDQYSIMELVETEDKRFWLAVPRTDVRVGDRVVYKNAEEARNFRSTSLNRTFDRILLAQQVFKVNARGEVIPPSPHAGGFHGTTSSEHSKRKGKIEKLAKPEGGQSVAQIVAEPKAFAGKTVKVRGMVVSALTGIRAAKELPPTNWYRLDDGSGDLQTVLPFTSGERLQRDDVVVITGKLTVGKRYPSGLSYKFIVEDAFVEREEPKKGNPVGPAKNLGPSKDKTAP